MKLTKLFLVVATFGAMLVVSDSAARADSNSGTFTVTAAVVAKCTIDTTTANIDFGSYDAFATQDYAQSGDVVVACTKNAPNLKIALSGGSNYDTVSKLNQMASGTERLKYGLYQESGHTTAWHNASRDISSVGKAGVTYTIYGLAKAQQDVGVGSYSDTVTATINF